MDCLIDCCTFSIFDDFSHYESRQQEEEVRNTNIYPEVLYINSKHQVRKPPPQVHSNGYGHGGRGRGDRGGGEERDGGGGRRGGGGGDGRRGGGGGREDRGGGGREDRGGGREEREGAGGVRGGSK